MRGERIPNDRDARSFSPCGCRATLAMTNLLYPTCHCEEERRSNRELFSLRLPSFARNDRLVNKGYLQQPRFTRFHLKHRINQQRLAFTGGDSHLVAALIFGVAVMATHPNKFYFV